MAKGKTSIFFCQSCGYESSKWMGQCPGCKEWNTFVEEVVDKKSAGTLAKQKATASEAKVLPLSQIEMTYDKRVSTDMKELDRVLGGGIVQGSMVLVGGDPGIGKSTFCSALCGLLPAVSGEVIFCGRKLSRSARTKQFGMVMQDVNHQLFSDSVKNECLSANPNATNQEIENLLNSFDLLDCIDRHPLTLSGGQRQRLAICQAIMGKKKFLIFDEPTSGLDFRHMCQVTEWLKQLAQHGYILFVVTHDYEFLNRACNCYVRIDKIN